MSKALGNNPLFRSEPVVEREEAAQIVEPEETEELDEFITMIVSTYQRY